MKQGLGQAIQTILIGAVIATAPQLVSAESSVEKFQLKTCKVNKDKCLSIEADRAVMSSVQNIFYAKDMKLRFMNKNGSLIESLDVKSGFIDLPSNQVVIRKIKMNGDLEETTVSLDSLEKSSVVSR